MAKNNSVTMQERDLKKVTALQRVSSVFSYILRYAFLILVAIAVLFPFYWMIISSLKSFTEYRMSIPTFWPKQMLWSNYVQAFNQGHLGELFGNTVLVGVVSTLLSLVITILAAFAFARLEFKGKNLLFGAMLATMMIPGELFTITNYITVVRDFKWGNTFAALIIPFLVSVFYVYLLRQNFLQIPNELYLAAKVDGTSDFKYLLKVMIPLALPTIISITILKMMGSWNSYMWPNLVMDPEITEGTKQLITVGIRKTTYEAWENGIKVSNENNIPVQMAAVTLVSIPLFLVFIFFRKYIMKGVSRAGTKG